MREGLFDELFARLELIGQLLHSQWFLLLPEVLHDFPSQLFLLTLVFLLGVILRARDLFFFNIFLFYLLLDFLFLSDGDHFAIIYCCGADFFYFLTFGLL